MWGSGLFACTAYSFPLALLSLPKLRLYSTVSTQLMMDSSGWKQTRCSMVKYSITIGAQHRSRGYLWKVCNCPLQIAWSCSRTSEVKLRFSCWALPAFFPPRRAPVPYSWLCCVLQAVGLLALLQTDSALVSTQSWLPHTSSDRWVGTHVKQAALRTWRGLLQALYFWLSGERSKMQKFSFTLEGISWNSIDQDKTEPQNFTTVPLNLQGLPPTLGSTCCTKAVMYLLYCLSSLVNMVSST